MNEILVEENSMKKLLLMAEIMDYYEFMTLSLNRNKEEENGELIINDFLLNPNQIVGPVHVSVKDLDLNVSNKLIIDGVKMLGRAHSHGHSAVFYSGTDRDQFAYDIASLHGQVDDVFADLTFNKSLIDKKTGDLNLVTLNPSYIELNFDEDIRQHGEALEGMLNGRIHLNRTKKVSGITVNSKGEIFGIVRHRKKFLLQDFENFNFTIPKKSQDFIQKRSIFEYSIETPIRIISSQEKIVYDPDMIIKELKSTNIRFSGRSPKAFNNSIYVDKRQSKDSRVSEREVIDSDNMMEEQKFYKSPKKRALDKRSLDENIKLIGPKLIQICESLLVVAKEEVYSGVSGIDDFVKVSKDDKKIVEDKNKETKSVRANYLSNQVANESLDSFLKEMGDCTIGDTITIGGIGFKQLKSIHKRYINKIKTDDPIKISSAIYNLEYFILEYNSKINSDNNTDYNVLNGFIDIRKIAKSKLSNLQKTTKPISYGDLLLIPKKVDDLEVLYNSGNFVSEDLKSEIISEYNKLTSLRDKFYALENRSQASLIDDYARRIKDVGLELYVSNKENLETDLENKNKKDVNSQEDKKKK